jgi:hypothetical protein
MKQNKALPKSTFPGFATVKMFAEKAPKAVPPILPESSPVVVDEQTNIESLLVENPDINAATFLNLLKSKGFKIVKDESVMPEGKQSAEAEGGSSNAAVLRAETKESAEPLKPGKFAFRARFTEALAKDDGTGVTRFRVALIQEGLGNMRDGFYYTKEALQSAIPIFEGKKIYADHPSVIDEQTRPERSVKDVLGHFESVKLEEGDDGQAMLTADVAILPDEPYRWARALMRHSVAYAQKYPDKDFIGLSINASGQANTVTLEEFNKSVSLPEGAKVKFAKALAEGLTEVKVVNRFDSATSCDLVTEAGAGGKILALLEQEKSMPDEKKPEDKKEEMKPEAEAQAEAPKPEAEAQPEAPHADEEQDIALIKKLIGEYLGDEEAESEEVMKHCKQAIEAYEAMGRSKEESMKCAGEYMKASKHMAGKQVESADADADDKKEESAPAVTGEKPDKKQESEHVEAMAQLVGENARLKEALKKFELKDHVETKCKESKEPRVITDEFKKLVEGAKTKGEIDKLWDAFTKGAASKRASSALNFSDFVMTEKSAAPTAKGESFADCLK